MCVCVSVCAYAWVCMCVCECCVVFFLRILKLFCCRYFFFLKFSKKYISRTIKIKTFIINVLEIALFCRWDYFNCIVDSYAHINKHNVNFNSIYLSTSLNSASNIDKAFQTRIRNPTMYDEVHYIITSY